MIDKIDWKETEDVKPFFGIIYPFCDVCRLKRGF
jgi:hypothetical protein